jgi:hypothetical protein
MNYKAIASLLLCLAPLSAVAQEPLKVTLGGRMDTQFGYGKESKYYRNTNPSFLSNPYFETSPSSNTMHKSAIVSDTKLDIKADGKYSADLAYGALIRLHADASDAANDEKTVGDKTMFYLQHAKIGRIEAGNYPGAGAAFESTVPFYDTGTWGVDGYWNRWVSSYTKKIPLGGIKGLQFITNPNLPSNYSGWHYSDAPKVTFYTKPLPGLTVGVSYIPDLDSRGGINGVALRNAGPTDSGRSNTPATFKEIFSGGGTYKYAICQDLKVKFGLAGEVGKAKLAALRDLKAYEANFGIKYKQIKLTTSYGNGGKTWTLKNPLPGAKQKSEYWTLGLGQQIDKLGYAVTYMKSSKAGGTESAILKHPAGSYLEVKQTLSDFRSNKLDVVMLDVDYKVAPGFLPYTGVGAFRFKESQGSNDKGYVAMAGTRLTF